MNKINHQILCILLDYIHTVTNLYTALPTILAECQNYKELVSSEGKAATLSPLLSGTFSEGQLDKGIGILRGIKALF